MSIKKLLKKIDSRLSVAPMVEVNKSLALKSVNVEIYFGAKDVESSYRVTTRYCENPTGGYGEEGLKQTMEHRCSNWDEVKDLVDKVLGVKK